MSAEPSGGRGTRGPRNAVVAVALVALLLVVVLAGLLREDGSGSSDGQPGVPAATSATSSAARGPTAGATTRPTTRPTARPTSGATARDPETGLRVVALATLPRQAQETVALVDRGGPFPYAQDGVTFANREGRLPAHPRGWYREYTVRTPGEGDRGPRRIVTGDGDRLLFYTADHYDSFVRVAR